jgi:hypothetical protein
VLSGVLTLNSGGSTPGGGSGVRGALPGGGDIGLLYTGGDTEREASSFAASRCCCRRRWIASSSLSCAARSASTCARCGQMHGLFNILDIAALQECEADCVDVPKACCTHAAVLGMRHTCPAVGADERAAGRACASSSSNVKVASASSCHVRPCRLLAAGGDGSSHASEHLNVEWVWDSRLALMRSQLWQFTWKKASESMRAVDGGSGSSSDRGVPSAAAGSSLHVQ